MNSCFQNITDFLGNCGKNSRGCEFSVVVFTLRQTVGMALDKDNWKQSWYQSYSSSDSSKTQFKSMLKDRSGANFKFQVSEKYSSVYNLQDNGLSRSRTTS